MKSIRVIPCLDIKEGRVVKGTNFVGLKDAGDPLELAEKYNNEKADELVFLDITATNQKRDTVIQLAQEVARKVFIPFTIGGGISGADLAVDLVYAGADKISVNSSAVARPELIKECAEKLGSQCIVVAVDTRHVDNEDYVFTKAGTHNTGIRTMDWIRQATELGAGEILLTSMDADGTREGFDNRITKKVSESLQIPVIASGGGGEPSHFCDAVTVGKADAVLAAGIFHYGVHSIGEVKQTMNSAGIAVRM